MNSFYLFISTICYKKMFFFQKKIFEKLKLIMKNDIFIDFYF